MSWSYATLTFADEELMKAISDAAIMRIRGHMEKEHDLFAAYEFTADLLALAWSLALSMEMTAEVARPLRDQVLLLGREMDRLACAEIPCSLDEDLEEAVEVQLPGVPFARVNLPGIMVVFKPENWEVNRGNPDLHRCDVEWRLLSDWAAAALPRSRFPLVHSSEFDFGFIHRLDVPSSGLIMSAKSFAGQALLRWQLDTYELEREYIVACHGPVIPAQRDIILRLSMDKENAKSHVSPLGAPARTRVSCLAYVFPWLDPDATCSLVAIKIHTGRHHQIRAHLTHLEHVTAGDGKYGRQSATLQDQHIYGDMHWFERFFGRPAVLNFLDAGPKR